MAAKDAEKMTRMVLNRGWHAPHGTSVVKPMIPSEEEDNEHGGDMVEADPFVVDMAHEEEAGNRCLRVGKGSHVEVDMATARQLHKTGVAEPLDPFGE